LSHPQSFADGSRITNIAFVGEIQMQSSVLETTATAQYAIARRHARCLFTVPVTLQRWLPDGVFETHGISLDISPGGIAVAVCSPPPVGETVDLQLLAHDPPCGARAIVRYNTQTQSGLEFLEAEPDLQRLIASVTQKPVARENVFVVK
jgi:hypothetical protein